jgi:LysM repeat protein
LPTEPPMPPQPPPAITHVLKPGEGLSFLSQYYGVTPNDLRAANPSVNFDKPKAGDSIKVPLELLHPGRVLPPQ